MKTLKNGAPVLDADPTNPVPGQQWWLYAPEMPSTKLAGQNAVVGGLGSIIISLNSTNLDDRKLFGDSSFGEYGNVTFSSTSAGVPVQAWGFYDFSANPLDGDHIGLVFLGNVIGDLTFKDTPIGPSDIPIGATLSDTLDNLITAANNIVSDNYAVLTKESDSEVRVTFGSAYAGTDSNHKLELAIWSGYSRITTSHLESGTSYLYGGNWGAAIIDIIPSPPQMGNINVQYNRAALWNDIVTAFIAWADANLSAPGLLAVSLDQPTHDGPLHPDSMQYSVYLQSDGSPETITLKIKSLLTDNVFTAQIN